MAIWFITNEHFLHRHKYNGIQVLFLLSPSVDWWLVQEHGGNIQYPIGELSYMTTSIFSGDYDVWFIYGTKAWWESSISHGKVKLDDNNYCIFCMNEP